MAKIYIVVLNYNSWEDTIECVESLLKLDYEDINIVIVDNCSPNDSVTYLKQWLNNQLSHYLPVDHYFRSYSIPEQVKPEVLFLKSTNMMNEDNVVSKLTFIESDSNGGFASGNNIGLNFCLQQPDFEYAWLLNNDTVVNPDSLSSMMSSISMLDKDHPDLKFGLYGHRLTHYYNPTTDQVSYYSFSKHNATVKAIKTKDTDCIVLKESDKFYPCGASMFVSKDFLTAVGLLAEDYFLYYEEPDWSIRAYRKGYAIAIFNNIPVFHKEGASAGSSVDGRQRSELSDYYIIKNRFTIVRKFFPQQLVFVYLTMLVIAINRLLRGQYQRIGMIANIILSQFTKSRQTGKL
jgi:GT2 family glycosyltransferase